MFYTYINASQHRWSWLILNMLVDTYEPMDKNVSIANFTRIIGVKLCDSGD